MVTTTDLSGKVIVVTGAGSGIGRATSLALARANATVILCDINGPSAEAVLQELVAIPTATATAASSSSPPTRPPHSAHTLDVTSPTACTTLIDQLSRSHTLTGLFNCAGINPTNLALTSTTDEYFTSLINTNLRGPYNVTRAIIPHLAPHSGCSIVNVSSTAGIRAAAGFAIYNMTKFGVIGFSKSVALELGPQGVRCNVVAPGSIDTPTNAGVMAGDEAVRKLATQIAMGRLGVPDEVADVVVFLFGDGARWMTGSVVEVTGGL